MKNWTHKYPPYQGDRPYVYFAFSEADSGKVWNVARILLSRGIRLWYCTGASGSHDELLRRQKMAAKASLTLIYMSDATARDMDTKSLILTNQNKKRSIICLDSDDTARDLEMGILDNPPHISLKQCHNDHEMENALIHTEGFSQELIGEPLNIADNSIPKRLTAAFCIFAAVLMIATFIGHRYLNFFRQEPEDEIHFSDSAITEAARKAAGGGALTEESVSGIREIALTGEPESWDDLTLLPALKTIRISQEAALKGAELPEGTYTIVLSGGDAS